MGISVLRKNLVRKTCTLVSDVSASILSSCWRGGKSCMGWPLCTAAVLQMLAAMVA